MNSIVICEKPSQARAIKAAIGNQHGDVYPAVGHILTLKEPDDVRESWKTWSAELLWPGQFYEKKVVGNTKKNFDAIKVAAKNATQIIIATDCDREGQLIGDEIVDFIGFRGRVLRAIFNAEDPKSLRDSFANLHPNENFRGLYMSGQAREQADQTSNLSLTRTATVVLKEAGSRGAIGIGRVKTPVLGIVCKRELEIENFKSQDMFEIDANVAVKAGSLMLNCQKLPATLIKEQAASTGEQDDDAEAEELAADEAALEEQASMVGRILDRRIAEAVAQAAKGYQGKMRSKSEKKKQGPPKLFDLTALQSTCSSRFGWTGEKTLSVAQQLYSERTMITYPRGEAKYLPDENINDIPRLVPALTGLPGYGQFRPLLEKPQVRRGKSGHFSSEILKKEGLSHYAIIPNVNTANQFASLVPRLSSDEAKMWDVIVRQYLAALSPDHEYRQTTVSMDFPFKGHDWEFRAAGRVPLVPGWKAILGGAGSVAKGDEELEMCAVENGETGTITETKIKTATTRPPVRYTEGALIKVMQEAWRLVDEPKMRARLKEAKGIGTPATRGDVLKGLISQGQIVMKGKSLMPSDGGMTLYKTLMAVCPNVVDPARTALWETIFDGVEKGRMTAEDAVDKILVETKREIDRIVANAGAARIAIGGKSKPTPKMAELAKKIAERKGISLPRGVLSDSIACRKFLDDNMPKRDPNAQQGQGGEYPPSEKQLAFAERIATDTGKQIPQEARASARQLSAWIDANAANMPLRAPSEKQLAFARKLSEEKGVAMPADAETDGKACSAFIDKMMGGGGTGSRSGGKSVGKTFARKR
ncbi:DNA topoisomerase [Paracoccus litorisediminis]|uniref:DNA topoisomerase n=1 Tax=Paracoccus litorisediminis TaxID=2006130 RepID=UPI00373180A7